MRFPRVLVALALLSLPSAAFAGKVDPLPTIVLTGISQFDGVFGQAKDIQDKLKSETETLAKARTDSNTVLGIANAEAFAGALAELQKKAEHKIKVISDGGIPKLNPEAAVPDDVQKGIDAVNGLISAANHTITTATGLKTDATQLASACSAFPGQVPSLVSNPLEVVKKGKVVGDDTKATGALPDRLQLLIDEASKIVSDVQAAFAG